MDDRTPQAISAALSSDWEKAIEINTAILCENKDDVDCLNRLGKAYLELGESKKAATICRRVLKIDRYDPIAMRNLARCQASPVCKKAVVPAPSAVINFLEEPGKTKLVALVNLAPAHTLLKLNQTDQVVLASKRHTVVVLDADQNYLGSLPDDLGHRLLVLIKGGNKYSALIKSVSKSSLVIFIRELCRARKFADTPSFASSSQDYFSFVRDELLSEGSAEAEPDADDETAIGTKLHADEEPEAT